MSAPVNQVPQFQAPLPPHTQPVTPTGSHPHGNPHSNPHSNPHPQFANFRFPPQNFKPIPQQSDPDYVISPGYSNPHDINIGRRASLQFPPVNYRHKQSDSYDSQTSLSTLADIASSNINEEEHKDLLEELTSSLASFQKLNQIVVDINTDFRMNLEASGEMNDKNAFAKSPYFNKFINNIPIPALKEAIGVSHDINQLFQHWLIQREREEQQAERERIAERQSRRASTGHIRQSPAGQSRRKPSNAYPYPVPPKKKIERISTPPVSPSKKRKPSRKSPKSDNISLIVKPPKPTTDISKPLSVKGELQDDLRVKIDHNCQQCGSDDTPEWRRGPYGSRSLCNACGLFFGKLSKKFGIEEATRLMIKRKENGEGDDRRIPNEEGS